MADNDNDEDPEQLKLMKRMVELAVEQVELARKRTDMSADRSKMSADRSRMSEDRSRMSADRSRMSADRTGMSEDRSRMSGHRSRMSAARSEMSAERSYMNAERTLSVWTRTALALMVFGIAIDRFDLFLRQVPKSVFGQGTTSSLSTWNALSAWGGEALIALGVFVVIVTAVRFLVYSLAYHRAHEPPIYHGPYIPFIFTSLVALFGIALLVVLFALPV
jgi:putative membrane protein